MDWDAIEEYTESRKAGDQFPAIDVFWDGTHYWLARGFHRWHSADRAGEKHHTCNVHDGSLRDAILFAVGDNAKHGVRRTPMDKRRSARLLLEDPEWANWSDREIARRCVIGHHLVAKVREEIAEEYAKAADSTLGARPSGKRRKQLNKGKTITAPAKKPALTGVALAEQLARNERKAAFRNLDKMSPEYREWLEVLGDDATDARAHFKACVEAWEAIQKSDVKRAKAAA